jgi:hypothetical protein
VYREAREDVAGTSSSDEVDAILAAKEALQAEIKTKYPSIKEKNRYLKRIRYDPSASETKVKKHVGFNPTVREKPIRPTNSSTVVSDTEEEESTLSNKSRK